jgi:hypothetical protein
MYKSPSNTITFFYIDQTDLIVSPRPLWMVLMPLSRCALCWCDARSWIQSLGRDIKALCNTSIVCFHQRHHLAHHKTIPVPKFLIICYILEPHLSRVETKYNHITKSLKYRLNWQKARTIKTFSVHASEIFQHTSATS